MDSFSIAAASGMKTRITSLDILANNIANTGTAGFKSDQEFYNLYGKELPVVQGQWTDFSQGSLTPTGNPLNLALSGKGMFALNSPGGTVYTRNGDIRISKTNELETPQGYTLRNVLDQGHAIKVDPRQTIEIGKDGVVSQGGQDLGQIEISELDAAPQATTKLGNSYFVPADKAAPVSPATDSEVYQGQMEQSNVPVAESAVKLVSVLRQFEMMQKALNLGADMNKSAIQEVAKVSQ
jgi:flagellar basal-body rod protein FlgF